MKITLELNLVEPGVEFLNYWDSIGGNDVVAQIIDGKLWMEEPSEEGDVDELPLREVSLVEFIHLVAASAGFKHPEGGQ